LLLQAMLVLVLVLLLLLQCCWRCSQESRRLGCWSAIAGS
jgi:hypothetical protein